MKNSKEIKPNSLMRLVSLSEYCDRSSYEKLLGTIVLIDSNRYCDTCRCEHYYLKGLSGDLNIENFTKVNTRPYKVSRYDRDGNIQDETIY